MNRRTFILAGASALAVAAGCTDDDTDAVDDGDDVENDSISWFVRVYPALDIPDDVTVINAAEEDLTDVGVIASILEEAGREYGAEIRDEFDEDDHLDYQTMLFRRSLSQEEWDTIEDALDPERELTGHGWYVEFEDTVFVFWADADVP